mmetsp:Transcript_24952/g.64827  ORF Transcript_24952/g.64827 Transcript_24952/m.64827 type:complete len:240 (-) Transcript_24952:27-746(-)
MRTCAFAGALLLSAAAPAALPFATSANLHISTPRHSIRSAAGMACDKPSDVIVFWFGQEWVDGGMDAKEYADRGIKRWFFGGPALDAECQKFVPLIRSAGDGSLRGEAWDDVSGLIARLVLLDQLSRNAFRGTPEAFAYDNAAQQVAVRLLDRFAARPADLPWPAAVFLTTSLLHAEDVALHDRASAFLREHSGESHASASGGIRIATRRSAARRRTRRAPGSPPTRCRGGRGANCSSM